MKRLGTLLGEIDKMKLNQAIGADSWIIYRKKLLFTVTANQPYRIDFIPKIQGDFVAKCYLNSGDRNVYPDPNINGRWRIPVEAIGSTSEVEILVYSTKEGDISIVPA